MAIRKAAEGLSHRAVVTLSLCLTWHFHYKIAISNLNNLFKKDLSNQRVLSYLQLKKQMEVCGCVDMCVHVETEIDVYI